MESRTVSWLSVHLYVEPKLKAVEGWPMVGSLPWIRLSDDDPAKVASIFDAAQHWALRIENNQTAMAEASKEISAAADWPGIASALHRRRTSGVYIPREVA